MKSRTLITCSLLIAGLASADIKVYQSIDEQGNIYFSNIPTPNIESEELSIINMNTYTAAATEQSQDQQVSGSEGQRKARQSMQQGNNSRNANSQGQDTMPPPPMMEE